MIRRLKAEDLPRKVETPLHPKPKVLLVDLLPAVAVELRKRGFNVESGTFGMPYRQPKDGKYYPVVSGSHLPNHSEQEIIIIDLIPRKILDRPSGEKETPASELDWWVKSERGVIDPRPRAMLEVKYDFDRILENEGAFIIFGAPDYMQDTVRARAPYGDLRDVEQLYVGTWGFLTSLDVLELGSDAGREMTPTSSDGVAGILAKYLPKSQFNCTIKAPQDSWTTLAQNKYGLPVATFCQHTDSGGSILVLPQVLEKEALLCEIFSSFLPEVAPHLFPSFNVGRWVQEPDYELPEVIALEEEKLTVERCAANQIKELSSKVAEIRNEFGWQHDLLTKQGDELVAAVKQALAAIGFVDVRDIDAERDRDGETRREDLQIHDRQPILIVDVKGVAGHPSDADALQAQKHATIRMKEWKTTEVHAVTIINHQRNLPALQRDNTMPFRAEVLASAAQVEFLVATTWDLYRLIVSFRKNGWRPDWVIPLFYLSGRFEIVPVHYQFVGHITHVWRDAVGIAIESGVLRIGDRIAFETNVGFEEQTVSSLQIDKTPVECAEATTNVGVATKFTRPLLHDGLRVFHARVDQNAQ